MFQKAKIASRPHVGPIIRWHDDVSVDCKKLADKNGGSES